VAPSDDRPDLCHLEEPIELVCLIAALLVAAIFQLVLA
jgi:hypothetical protein